MYFLLSQLYSRFCKLETIYTFVRFVNGVTSHTDRTRNGRWLQSAFRDDATGRVILPAAGALAGRKLNSSGSAQSLPGQ